MNTHPASPFKLRLRKLLVASALLATAGAHAGSTSLDLYKLPEATKEQLTGIPKNLARWYLGANLLIEKYDQQIRIQAPDVDHFAESVLLSDDNALTVPLLAGTHDFIVDFSRYCTLTRFLLNNRSAAGTVQLFTSNTLRPSSSADWLPVAREPLSFRQGEIPSLRFAEIETRYLLIRLNLSVPGEVGNIGVTGPANITEVAFDRSEEADEHSFSKAPSPLVDYDYGSAFAGARIRYVSGGSVDDVFSLIDDDPTTTYTFPRGEEAVIVVDMVNPTEFRSVNAGMQVAEPGILHIHLTSHLSDAFEDAQASGIATLTAPDGHVERMQLADESADTLLAQLSASTPREFVRIPADYFRSIENTHSVHVTPETGPYVRIVGEIKHRYAIFRFIPDNSQALPETQTAGVAPAGAPLEALRAQAPAPTSFSGVSVVGEVQVNDIIFTQDLAPNGPPPPPPPPPPPLSR